MKRFLVFVLAGVVGVSSLYAAHKFTAIEAAVEPDHSDQCGWEPPSQEVKQLYGDQDESLSTKAPDIFQ